MSSRGRRAKFRSLATTKLDNAAGYAAAWLLNNDTTAADKAVAMLQQPGMISAGRPMAEPFGWYNTSRWLVPYAIAFDWLQDYPKFSAAQKEKARAVLMEGHKDCMSWLGEGRHIASNCFWIPYAGALASAIALYAEEPQMKSDYETLVRFLEKDMPPVLRELNGGWPEGWSYDTETAEWLTASVEMYRAFTGRDLWTLTLEGEQPYRQFMRGFLLAWRPDHTFIRYGDIVGGQKGGTAQHLAFFIQGCIRSTQDGELMWFLNEIERFHGYFAYTDSDGNSGYLHYGILYGLTDAGPALKEPAALSAVMGRNSLGLMVMRAGWGLNDPFISFRCGDYLGPGHSDYDSGQFEVFCKKGLAIDSGYYAAIGSPHYVEYHDRAIAHNVILAGEPGPAGDEGDQKKCRRGTLFNLDDLLHPGANETGDIIAFEDKGTYVYAAGDVSRAYDSGISSWTREMVYIRPGTLVICDRVRADAAKEKRFLLHTTNEPVAEGRTISIQNSGGYMEVVSLLPMNAKIRTIGGPGKEFWAKGKNWTEGAKSSPDQYDQQGAWRAEIYEEPGQASTIFLTAMSFGSQRTPCQAQLSRTPLSVVVNGRMVAFGQEPGQAVVK